MALSFNSDQEALNQLSEIKAGELSCDALRKIDQDGAERAGLIEAPRRPDWVLENPLLYQKFTPKQKAFLKAYAATFSTKKAAALAKVGQGAHRDWSFNDKNFRLAFESCKAMGVQMLEDVAVERAVDGVDEPVFYKGDIVGHVNRKSDRLLEFLLEANAPEKYRRNATFEHTGPGGGPIAIGIFDAILRGDQ